MNLSDPVLTAYQHEYAESTADWRQLETKVGATIVMSGAFLAAVIAVAGKALVTPGWIEVTAAALALLALFSGVFVAVGALRTQETTMPPDGNTVGRILAQARRRPFVNEGARRQAVVRLLRLHWYRAADDVQSGNRRKGAALKCAQQLVLLGGVLAAGFGLLRLTAATLTSAG